MTVVIGVLVGFLAGRLAWVAMRPVFGSPLLARQNYRERSVVTAAGLSVVVGVLVVEAASMAVEVAREDPPGFTFQLRMATLVVVLGFGLFGLLDDVAGEGQSGGFGGHLAELRRGRVTTGMAKLVAGGAVAVVAVVVAGDARRGLLTDAALVALAANLGNLFDRAPGRTTKVGLLAFVALVAAVGLEPALRPVAVVVGASLSLLLDDLHERVMLGDTGSNVLGAALGLGVVIGCGGLTRLVVLGVLVVLNLASEWVSFSKVIDAVPPLRFFDRMGRLSA